LRRASLQPDRPGNQSSQAVAMAAAMEIVDEGTQVAASAPYLRQGAGSGVAAQGLTGRAAAQALQQHIKQKGTTDVQTIDRLRRASLQPDRPGNQSSQAVAMAAAMAVIDD
jgi:hypothetical protein